MVGTTVGHYRIEAETGSGGMGVVYSMIVAVSLQPGVEGLLTPDLWTADGRVLFSGRLGDATNIWSVVVARDGRADQKPQRVTAGTDVEISPTVDSAGSLAYGAITNDVGPSTNTLDRDGICN